MKKERKQIRLKRKQIKVETIKIYPMMPTRYSPSKRKTLREFEKKILNKETIDLEKQKVKTLEKINRK